jgi:hypothetical protein
MAWAIRKRPDGRPLQHGAATKLSIGGDLGSEFPRGVFVRVPGENNPAVRAVRYGSVLGFVGKANGRLRI